jgi:hypothetical protein
VIRVGSNPEVIAPTLRPLQRRERTSPDHSGDSLVPVEEAETGCGSLDHNCAKASRSPTASLASLFANLFAGRAK